MHGDTRRAIRTADTDDAQGRGATHARPAGPLHHRLPRPGERHLRPGQARVRPRLLRRGLRLRRGHLLRRATSSSRCRATSRCTASARASGSRGSWSPGGSSRACTMFVTGPLSFYAVRFLLGIAEAGFFPGMILYLSYWFPARERARAVGFFMSAIPISYAIGAPISGGIMSIFDGVAGPRGLAVAVPDRGDPRDRSRGIFVPVLPRRRPRARELAPATTRSAGWPSASRARSSVRLTHERHTLGEVLKDRRVLAFGLLYFCMVVNVYGHLVLGRRDRRPDRRPQRRRPGLRDRDPLHRGDRRARR